MTYQPDTYDSNRRISSAHRQVADNFAFMLVITTLEVEYYTLKNMYSIFNYYIIY